jgi:hypothetical protein
LVIVIGIKDNQVSMSRHDNKGIDPQEFMLVTEIETFGQDEAGCFGDENGQPVNNGKGG